jgi:hypothetical protein
MKRYPSLILFIVVLDAIGIGFLGRRLPGYPGSIWLAAVLLYAPCCLVLRRKMPGARRSARI